MLVSLFADASFYPMTRAAGWGAWVKSDRGQLQDGGTFRQALQNAGEAELCAVVNGLWLALRRGVACPGDVVLVQSDCMRVRDLILETTGPNSDVERAALERLDRFGMRLRARHVPGHTSGHKPRLWVNNRCDAIARTGMLEGRARSR